MWIMLGEGYCIRYAWCKSEDVLSVGIAVKGAYDCVCAAVCVVGSLYAVFGVFALAAVEYEEAVIGPLGLVCRGRA